MLVIIKSAPDTPEGRRALKLASEMPADVALLQNAVYFLQTGGLEGFKNRIFVLDDDKKLRGLTDNSEGKNISDINYEGLIDLMAESDKVVGML